MEKYKIDFIKSSNKFIILLEDNKYEFNDFFEASNFYNKNVRDAKEIELKAIKGIVGLTIAYKYL